MTADAGAEVKAFNASAVWCKDQTLDDGRQQETLDANIASTNAAIENFAAFFGSDVDQKARPDISAAGSSEAQSWFFILGNGIVQLLKIAGKVTDHAFGFRVDSGLDANEVFCWLVRPSSERLNA